MAKRNILETWRGRYLDLLDPDSMDICIEDIAWGLSRSARFNGHTDGIHPYSVAQHSVWCAWAAQHWFNATATGALLTLLHDAHEAYTGDITQPLKAALNIGRIQTRLQACIHTALSLEDPDDVIPTMIHECDRIALAVEAHHLVASHGNGWQCKRNLPDGALERFWSPLPARSAYVLFLNTYYDLRNGRPLPDDLLEVLA